MSLFMASSFIPDEAQYIRANEDSTNWFTSNYAEESASKKDNIIYTAYVAVISLIEYGYWYPQSVLYLHDYSSIPNHSMPT